VGERVAFQIFAKRGKEEKALVADDGVELTVADTSVAESDSSLSVVGSAVGETDITARVGSQQVVARLHVTAASQADKSPQQQATALRFVPDTLTMQIGVPSTAVRLMKTYADGQESPLNELAEFDVQSPDVVEVKQSACGITFSAKKAGRTLVAARQGDLKTRQPLQIMVADAGAESVVQEARLSVSPDPLQLTVGGTGEFREVQLELQNGGTPVPVDYSIESQDKKTVSVDGKTLRGLNAGRATVIVSSTTPDKKDLKAKVSVEVASALDGDTKDLRLALSGPSRTSVGAEVQFKVVLTSDAGSKDVTHDDVGLVMDRDQLNLAEVEPGCVILAKSPGTLTVRAIHKNLVSDPLQLQIDPLSKGIERLELEIDVRPLAVGEVRNYRLWAYPVGGAPRQDLTRDVVADGSDETKPRVALQLVEPKNGGEVVLHKPPKLIAKAPGRVVITASFEKYHSEPIQLEVIQSDSSGSSIAIEPKVISVRVGERTPQIRVTARNPGEGSSRTVEAVFEIENPEILAAVPEITNQFEAKSPGKTRIKAIVGKQEAWADVSVLYQPFRDVRLQPETIARPGGRFQVVVAIEAIGDGMNLEYRIVPVGKAEGTPWKAATAEGTRHRVQMESIDLPVGPVSTEYHLMIEVRGAQQTAVERYPLDFRIKTGTLTVEQQKPSSGKSEKSENV
jgi:hypothetical protein